MMAFASCLAQTVHRVGGSAELTEPLLTDIRIAGVSPAIGVGAGAEVLYELQSGSFLLHTGVGFSWSLCRNRADVAPFATGIAEYASMHYHFTTERFKANTQLWYVSVPLMVGADLGDWYMLAGAKLMLMPQATTQSRAKVTVWATDDDLLDPIYDAYTHSMGTFSFAGDRAHQLMPKLGVMASAEVGYTWRPGPNAKMLIRIAAFADCGVMNMLDYQANPAPDIDADGAVIAQEGGAYQLVAADNLRPLSYMGLTSMQEATMLPVRVGFKTTILFRTDIFRRTKCRCLFD